MAIKGNTPPRKKAVKKSVAARKNVIEEKQATSGGPAAGSKKAAAKKAATKKATAKKTVAKKTPTAKKVAVAKKTAAKKPFDSIARTGISYDERREMIATMAYYLAEKHGFQPGRDKENWLECERIVDELLKQKGVVTKG